MELAFNDGLLGEYDIKNETAKGLFAVESSFGVIAGILGGILAVSLLFSLIQCGLVSWGSCLGCNSCIGCETCAGCESRDCEDWWGCDQTCYDSCLFGGCLEMCGESDCIGGSCDSGVGEDCYSYGYDCRQGCALTRGCDDLDYQEGACRTGCFHKKTKTYYAKTSTGEVEKYEYVEYSKGCNNLYKYFGLASGPALDVYKYKFYGVYKDASMKELLIDEHRNVVGNLEDGKTYYAHYVEYAYGEQIKIEFVDYATNVVYNSKYFSVGEDLSSYQFNSFGVNKELDGIYTSDNKMVFDSNGFVCTAFKVFHLYNFTDNPAIIPEKITLYVKFK